MLVIVQDAEGVPVGVRVGARVTVAARVLVGVRVFCGVGVMLGVRVRVAVFVDVGVFVGFVAVGGRVRVEVGVLVASEMPADSLLAIGVGVTLGEPDGPGEPDVPDRFGIKVSVIPTETKTITAIEKSASRAVGVILRFLDYEHRCYKHRCYEHRY